MKNLKIIYFLLVLFLMFVICIYTIRATNSYVKRQRIYIEAYEECIRAMEGTIAYKETKATRCIQVLNGGE